MTVPALGPELAPGVARPRDGRPAAPASGRLPADGRPAAYPPRPMAELRDHRPSGEIAYTVRRSTRARRVRVNVHAHVHGRATLGRHRLNQAKSLTPWAAGKSGAPSSRVALALPSPSGGAKEMTDNVSSSPVIGQGANEP